MPDAFEITNPELIKRVKEISNGTIKDVVINGESQELANVVVDTISGGELAEIVEGTYEVPINDGSVNFIHYEGTDFVDAPVTSTTAIQKTVPAGPITQYNSNTTAIQRGRIVQPYNASVADGKVNLSSVPKLGSFAANAAYFLGEVNQATAAASVGIMLGKTVDSVLYNLNPDFWDSNGMGSINPETWSSITHGDDSLQAKLFNMIFGIDPDTGNAQAYLNQDAFAYLSYFMQQNGVFDPKAERATSIDETKLGPLERPTTYNFPVMLCGSSVMYISNKTGKVAEVWSASGEGTIKGFVTVRSYINTPNFASDAPFTITVLYPSTGKTETHTPLSWQRDGKTYYYWTQAYSSDWKTSAPVNIINNSQVIGSDVVRICFGSNIEKSGGVDGIGEQEGATLPDTTNWTDVPTTLNNLQNQYPDLWDDGITYDQIQPDGTLKPTTYIPVGWPSINGNPWTNIQPTTDPNTSTQAQPYINLNNYPNPNPTPFTQTITLTPTPNPNPSTTVPQNPTDTGNGSTDTPVPPVGDASALWSVYHPTQAQVNSFGAWLWTDNIITKIQQILQNPMEGIITLHKVFAPPVDSGQGTIVVGRLDSQVPSATVNQQYVTVDCGEIDCLEQFGNVFDYSPYTSISIYLPFIGIAPLSVNDIMRSKIRVTYGVDIFTGVCLAMVEVTRDGNTINMYQYAGVASVEYPLTGTVHNGLITGIMGIVGGFATIATAGAAAPAAIGGVAAAAAGALATGSQSQSRSGNFSGNAGAMGIKTPYLIIERPQTKVADTFPQLAGYPTNKSITLNECSGHIVVKHVHVEGINATQGELIEIENLLQSGVLV